MDGWHSLLHFYYRSCLKSATHTRREGLRVWWYRAVKMAEGRGAFRCSDVYLWVGVWCGWLYGWEEGGGRGEDYYAAMVDGGLV